MTGVCFEDEKHHKMSPKRLPFVYVFIMIYNLFYCVPIKIEFDNVELIILENISISQANRLLLVLVISFVVYTL